MVVSGKKGVSIPIMLMHEGEGMVLTVETKHDCVYRGLVEYAEDCMNIRMRDVLLTYPDGNTKHLQSVWIPGFTVRFVVFPDILEHSPMFRRVEMQSKGKKVSTGLGVLRYAGIRSKTAGTEGAGYGDRDFSIMRRGPGGPGLQVYLGGGRPGPFGGPRPGFGGPMRPYMGGMGGMGGMGMGMGMGMGGGFPPRGMPPMMGGRPPAVGWGPRPGAMGQQGMHGGARPPSLPAGQGSGAPQWGGPAGMGMGAAPAGPRGAAGAGAPVGSSGLAPGSQGQGGSAQSSSSSGPSLQLPVQGNWNPDAASSSSAGGHGATGGAGMGSGAGGATGGYSGRKSRWG